jgi:cytochrome c oxidase subunit 3
MEAWGLPALNTLFLLSSGVTITWAHWGIKEGNHFKLCFGLFLTIVLGISFLVCQGHEYAAAYHELGLTLSAGIYGSTFFMLTGFHGAHVTIGTIMLIVIFFRALAGHFTAENHFAFEGVAWYWHFVDVVWLFLFIFVYWL